MLFYQLRVTHILLILVFAASCQMQTPVTVKTNIGSILGFQEYLSIDGEQKIVTKFLGVPFAESTAGINRFMKPVAKKPFQSTFDARKIPLACYQRSREESEDVTKLYGVLGFSEDCLTLNVYVPHDLQSNNLLPVMIWIHGGGFAQGTASMYKPEILSVFGNVIVVTVNYRLGMFGFLRDKNGILPGNQGLWDQHLAIKWVHDNIGAFLGYKDEITILGESAGGASVLLQALYPGNKGLFKRVIAESGTALSPWALYDISTFEKYLSEEGCLPATRAFLSCLQSKDPLSLQTNSTSFGPVVDDDFLVDSPVEIIKGKADKTAEAREFFSSLDITVGVNDKDGAIYFELFAEVLGYSDFNFNTTKTEFRELIVPGMVNVTYPSKNDETRNALENMLIFLYTNWKDPDDFDDIRRNIVDMATDASFGAPALETAHAHASLQRGNTYFYEFAAEVPYNYLPLPINVKGANHGSEVAYVLGLPLTENGSFFDGVPLNHTSEEKVLSRAAMAFWSNFAKSGNPNFPMDVFQYTKALWPQFTLTSQRYFKISNQMSPASIVERFHPRRMAFWLNVIDQLENMHENEQAQAEIVHFDPSRNLIGRN